MERDMGTTLATKQDLDLLGLKIDALELRMTVKLGSMIIAAVGLTIAALRLWS
jgi:hypothetical protein